MTEELISLAVIVLVAALCPIVAQSIPKKPIPETVFLLIAGALLGPNMAGIIDLSDSISLLSELGLAFLFLLAGFEIDPKNVTGHQGKRGFVTWLVCLALGFAAVEAVSLAVPAHAPTDMGGVAVAIALGTTALGTLMPILKERNLIGTKVGDSVLAYGTWGELGPIIAMALLLSSRAEWKTLAVLLAFAAIAVLAAVIPTKARKAGSRVYSFLSLNGNTTSQTTMRVTVLLLVVLVALSTAFQLDAVLGAFAAGFVLRYVIPSGNHDLEHKLDGAAFGFFVPLFFVVSGAKIDLMAVFDKPVLLVGFIAALLLIRAVPIFISLSIDRETRTMSSHNRVSVALYCTTALPLIVAVTSVATTAGAMSDETASVLVAAGAITVLAMPLLAQLTYRVADVHPVETAREVAHDPRHVGDIVGDRMAYAQLADASELGESSRRQRKLAKARARLEKQHKRHDLVEQAKEERRQRRFELMCEARQERSQKRAEPVKQLKEIDKE